MGKMAGDVWRFVVPRLGRALGSSAVRVAMVVSMSAFSVGLLCGVEEITALLAVGQPLWAALVEPVAGALLMGSLGAAAVMAWPLAHAAVSPRFRFRCMAGDVDSLAESLSDGQCGEEDAEGGSDSPELSPEVKIAAVKGALESIKVRSPPISDLEGWHDYLSMLRGWIASRDLEKARWYHHRRTAIADYR